MIGKIIGGIAGAKAANHIRGLGGTGGALIGAAVPALLRRFGPLGLIAAVAGGYAFKRYSERSAPQRPAPKRAAPKRRAPRRTAKAA